ncbi:MAG: helix-turn-helix transcriptional regulator [bacterium]|nr:helix-turn-helix transcriptional regulator [bacterium]
MKVKDGLHYELIELFGDERQMAEEGLIFDVSQQLFEVMEKNGVSKAELASRLDCSKAYVTKLLRGPSNMTLRKVAEVFHALGYVLKLKAAPKDEEMDWECVKKQPDRRPQDTPATSKVSTIPIGERTSPKKAKAASSRALPHLKTHGAAASVGRKPASTRGGVRKAHAAPTSRKRTSTVGSAKARKKNA